MAVMKLDITFDGAPTKDGKPTTYTRSFTVDSSKIPLALVEGMDDKNFGMVRRGLTRFLKLTEDESEQLTIETLNAFAAAAKEASEIPNG